MNVYLNALVGKTVYVATDNSPSWNLRGKLTRRDDNHNNISDWFQVMSRTGAVCFADKHVLQIQSNTIYIK